MKKLALAIVLLSGMSLYIEHLLSKDNYVVKKVSKKNVQEADWKSKPLEYWKEALTPEQYRVCRLKGTEPAFSGIYDNFYAPGTYVCSNCSHALFDSHAKFNSGTGWPSFTQPINSSSVITQSEDSLFKTFSDPRIEVVCARCNAHLGHVFDDGPQPTGKRYCLNSVSLKHKPE